MARAKYLAWVDLETTGVDETEDPILEVGLIVTSVQAPFDELASYEGVVFPSTDRWPFWPDRMNETVLNMHTTNGLLVDVSDNGIDMAEVEQRMVDVLAAVGRPHNFMLAGSGVGHFDRKFLEAQMPNFAGWLQYPNLDIGVIRRALDFAGRNDLTHFGESFDIRGQKPHRGLADVRDHLVEWRLYAEMFTDVPYS